MRSSRWRSARASIASRSRARLSKVSRNWSRKNSRWLANQPFNLALVVALGRTAKAIFKQVMALQFAERLGAFARSVTQNLGHRNLGIVVEDRLRNPAQPGKCGDMAIQKGFGRFGRIGFDEDGIRSAADPCKSSESAS